jgi:gliding motility-associated-like protein
MDCATCPDVNVQPGQSTTYKVVAIDVNGCEAEDTVSVEVIDDYTLWTPNAFTPNGDGNNDFFQAFGNLAGISKFEVLIFDRWGEKVFESNDTGFQWDGIYKGELMQPGVYVFIIKSTFLDGHREKLKKGSVTLVR